MYFFKSYIVTIVLTSRNKTFILFLITGEPLLLLILKKLRKLDYVQNNVIIPDIQEVLNYIKPQRLEVQETNVPITLPIDNDTQLNEFEQYISTTENYRIMVSVSLF